MHVHQQRASFQATKSMEISAMPIPYTPWCLCFGGNDYDYGVSFDSGCQGHYQPFR